ncbi:MAG: hypothetical protein Hens3KO_03730 [Henriciella sp.]
MGAGGVAGRWFSSDPPMRGILELQRMRPFYRKQGRGKGLGCQTCARRHSDVAKYVDFKFISFMDLGEDFPDAKDSDGDTAIGDNQVSNTVFPHQAQRVAEFSVYAAGYDLVGHPFVDFDTDKIAFAMREGAHDVIVGQDPNQIFFVIQHGDRVDIVVH